MLRFNALTELQKKKPIVVVEKGKRSQLFAAHVFNEEAMHQRMTLEVFESVMQAIRKGTKIDRKIADQVAIAMRDWAIEKGATHYTHWFQPLTGGTAEKHDAFFEPITRDKAMEHFSGNQLVQQESDASSFPNGGIRNTFEARGYTAWDPSSPPFVFGTVLCIPTIFIAYTGEALDNKTPLLKALSVIDKAATEVVQYFDKNVSKVTTTLGCEQEYFLIDKTLASTRPDLLITGRTLLGHTAAKGQQLEDHYLGAIPSRVLAYMRDLEQECLLLGIPVKTRHNEVAPNQFELAPIFGEANLAVDQNALLMELMRKVAERHDFLILFHEKPFAGVNGSGKHNNWSLVTNTGVNLLSPGRTPLRNLQFLTFFLCTIKAVHTYESLLRASIASATNDYRLGANEAPPAIMSVFIGEQLTKVLQELEKASVEETTSKEKNVLNVLANIPDLLIDATDRNRTSPFAFTGNKFEFRAVGAKANCGKPMMVLSTIVAKQLMDFKKEVNILLKKNEIKKEEAILKILREYVKVSKPILFEGDGYSKAWEKEAQKRGLSNHKTTPEALKENISEKAIVLFQEMGVLSRVEIEARYEIALEEYVKTVQIEARVLGDIARNHVVPTAVRYQNILIENVRGLKEVFAEHYEEVALEQMDLIRHISEHIKEIHSKVSQMVEARKKVNLLSSFEEKARGYCYEVKPFFDQIRYHCDKLELMVDDELWTLTKYRELLSVN
ncbi:glutamine synthetase III [Capnocytophaga sp. oral taxon 338]|uniref:glutamine synthetase III family protein n=1 Tax=Capnocytophaga sp. oral taxon 338 TaxID=710239 RepID=UPI000202CBBE|nr:glutamine synthetase III [Capnocytophaga sp. oral taxon 338]EGD35057.1 glutamine synthetase [Capnocytophaga sp. oral taxon 338 str. F0234]